MKVGFRSAVGIAFVVTVACGGITSSGLPSPDGGDAGGAGAGGKVVSTKPGTGYCGDGTRNGGELCDGSDLGGETCQTATMGSSIGGRLFCTAGCTFNLSGCVYASPGGPGGISGTTGVGGAPSGGAGGSGGVAYGSGGRDPGSFGDPHVLTLDGLKYDFQAVGEFILIEDADDPSFVVQVRQSRFLGFTTMSVNTAVAASVAGDRVVVYARKDPPVWIDGTPRVIGSSEGLSRGGTVTNDGGVFVIRWPTGEELTVLTAWKALVNVSYRPSESRPRSHVRGLLGTHDSNAANDLTTRSGKTLRTPSRPNDLYAVFGQSYRIRDAESLFDYSEGESTATFTDRSFPLLHGTPPRPPAAAVARARASCERAGVTGAQALEACATDVAITGDIGFARAMSAHGTGRREHAAE